MKNPLPDMPDELINLAIDDLERAEQDPRYRIHMGQWHSPWDGGSSDATCHVCLAGAVMARTLGADPKRTKCPRDYLDARYGDTTSKLEALDYFRVGSVSFGLKSMYVVPEEFREYDIPDYEEDPALFKKAMRELADELAKFKFRKRETLSKSNED